MIEKTGTYQATVDEAVIAESQANGTPSVKFKLTVPDEGTAYYDAWLTDRALDRTIENLIDVFGFDGDFANLDQFKGKECQIKIQSEVWEGKTRYKVAYLNHKDGGGIKAMDEAKANDLAARLTARAGAIVRKKEKANLPF